MDERNVELQRIIEKLLNDFSLQEILAQLSQSIGESKYDLVWVSKQ